MALFQIKVKSCPKFRMCAKSKIQCKMIAANVTDKLLTKSEFINVRFNGF